MKGWTYGRTYGRFRQNQNYLDTQITKFSFPWCSAARAQQESSAMIKNYHRLQKLHVNGLTQRMKKVSEADHKILFVGFIREQ